jgi:AraC-like DNA-binding protein
MIARLIVRAFAAAVGPASAELLARAQLQARDLEDDGPPIPPAAIRALWEHAPRLAGDDDFGLHAAQLIQALGTHEADVLVYVVRASGTMAQAFARLSRYQRFLSEHVSFSFEREAELARLRARLHGVPTGGLRHAAECVLAAPLLRARTLTGVADLAPREVRFAHRAPTRTDEHARLFRCPVRFGEPVDEMVFDPLTLDATLLTADPRLCALLDKQAQEMIAAMPPADSVASRVRALVCANLGRDLLGAGEAARRLGMSARSLQRRLHEEGSSFSALVDEVRRDAALRYLGEPRLTVAEIAFALGFAEPAAFYRAFRRWTGASVTAFRGDGV